MTLHYTRPAVIALAAYLHPLEMTRMPVKLLKDNRVSVKWRDEQIEWFLHCYFNMPLPDSPIGRVAVRETFEQFQRKYNFV